jgi:hypothetical protein
MGVDLQPHALQQPQTGAIEQSGYLCLKRITSLTWSSSLSFGFGMNPSRGLDAVAFPTWNPIFFKEPYGQ